MSHDIGSRDRRQGTATTSDGRRSAESREWTSLARHRFSADWEALPLVTVLAALPGWGRTTWLRQCHDHQLARDSGATIEWLGSRRAIDRFLADAAGATSGSTARFAFIDDVVETSDDPIWQLLVDRLPDDPLLHVVVSSIDHPPMLLTQHHEVRVFDERDLAFDDAEIAALVSTNAPDAIPGQTAPLASVLLGCPVLCRRHLERLRNDGPEMWTSPDTPHEVSLLADVIALARASERTSMFLRTFADASALRRFSAEMLADGRDDGRDDGHRIVIDRCVARLRAMPLGAFEVDNETGLEMFEWSRAAWREIDRQTSPSDRAAGDRHALDLARRSGQITMQLFHLARLGEFTEADRLVFDHFRLFLLATNSVTHEALRDVPTDRLTDCPSVLLLLGELEARRTGSAAAAARYHRLALQPLQRLRPTSRFDRLRVRCRQVFASVSLGDRQATRRGLDAVDELLGARSGRGVIDDALHDPTVAANLAAELYAPFWAATQVDRHDRAHDLAALMRTHANPASPTAVAERYTVVTQEVFVGTHSSGDSAGDAAEMASDTDPIVLLESGRDGDVAGFVAAMLPRLNKSPSRSALEAFVLLIRALVAPAGLKLHDVQLPLDRSSRFWSDGTASSFIRFSATFALLAIGERDQARALSRAQPIDDWFDVTAAAMIALDQGDASSAMELLDRATYRSWGPRADAITTMLAAAAHCRLGQVDAAAETVRAIWTQASPLARFATRFVTTEDFAALIALDDKLPPDVAAGLAAARDDARPLRRTQLPRLTRAERELLALLRAGRTYSEIATIRVVSINTVRTQLRSLRHKLGAVDRVDAVRRAEALCLFDD